MARSRSTLSLLRATATRSSSGARATVFAALVATIGCSPDHEPTAASRAAGPPPSVPAADLLDGPDVHANVALLARALRRADRPVIAEVTPSVLVPGAEITITGLGFDSSSTANMVMIDGAVAQVVSATRTRIVARTPCTSSGAGGLGVVRAGFLSNVVSVRVEVPKRSVALGEAMVFPAAESSCNELVTDGAAARYLVSVFSTATSFNTLTSFELRGNSPPIGGEPVQFVASDDGRTADLPRAGLDAVAAEHDRTHLDVMERSRQLFASLRRPVDRGTARADGVSGRMTLPVLGDARAFRYNFTSCSDTTVAPINAKLIYAGTKALIWEDVSNTLRSDTSAVLSAYYQRLGLVYDAEMHDVIKNNFGDPLRRDAALDNDGRIHMVFTQRLNGTGAAAYVHSCDQYPRSQVPNSNVGEFFYSIVPTTATLNVNSTSSPDGWFAFIGRTVIHEVKHIASMSARVANAAPQFEIAAIEEGTARHAEELWARQYLHGVAWKGNTTYGAAGTTSGGIWCDFNLASAACNAANARRPSWGVRRQFNELLPKLQQPWNHSVLGGTSEFYQTVWSLVRYTIDRHGASDAAFLTALTNSTGSGLANLATLAGTTSDQLVGKWSLALFADDYPGLASPSADISMPSWNMRGIYAGLHQDPSWSGRFTRAFMIAPVQLGFGSFVAERTGLRGGANAYFEISGPAALQLLDLRATGAAYRHRASAWR